MTRSFTRFPAPSAFVFLLTLASLSPAQALTYLVGAGAVPGVCDFNNLQSAINAAASNPGEDFIRVASDQTYSALALSIGQQDLTLTGGYANCSAALPPGALPSGSTILNGAGGAAAPVVSISGSGVRVLTGFQIRNGDNVQGNGLGCGGGIYFNGRGELRIQNVGISQNNANSGGGICFVGTATPTALTIESDVVINNNNAITGNGGGVAIAGTARMFALRDRTYIALNGAPNGNGGGIYLQPPANVDIGSPGYTGNGVIYGNNARRGGGVAGVAPDGSDEYGCVRFFTTDASRPVRIQNNKASEFGGALFMQSHQGMEENASISSRLYDFVVDGNTAPNGAALFLQGDSSVFTVGDTGPRVGLNDFSSSCNESVDTLGAVRCTQSAQCNRIERNRTEDSNGQPTNGNIVEMRLYAAIVGQTVTMKGNIGTRLISWSDGNETDFTVSLFRSALIDNVLTQELFRGFSDGEFRLVDSTVAGNSIGAAHVFRHDADNDNQITNAVIDQPGKLTLSHPNVSSLDVVNTWVIATDTSSLRPDPTALPARGRFTDPERGDYRLRIGSQALDYAPGSTPTPANDVDLDGRLRNFDQGDVSANTRARDVGAFERQSGDRWLPNGDFVGDLRLWFNPEPAFSTWDAAFNAPVSSGGSLILNIPADQTTPTDRRTALTHCFNVPWSGDFQISGFALVAASQNNRDYPVLNWRLRYDSEDCSGPETASGNTFFGRSGTTWQPLTAPLTVSVDPAQWTWNTTIEIRLEVAQNPTSPTATSLFARFDEIEIRKFSDAVFADSFEEPL